MKLPQSGKLTQEMQYAHSRNAIQSENQHPRICKEHSYEITDLNLKF